MRATGHPSRPVAGDATAALIGGAFAWQDWMTAIGFADALDAVREAFRDLRRG